MSVVLASLHEPPVLLLDEPFDGVDPLGVDATMTVVREATDSGRTVLISTHLIELATDVCDDAVVLRAGQAVSRSAAEELRGDQGRQRYRELLR
jgi:ABC-2 type transport system ATP-binding protein